jgi:hypothetical protein
MIGKVCNVVTMSVESILLNGNPQSAPDPLILRSGPLTMLYTGGFIRQIKAGELEVLRLVYFAVRDHNWETIPGIFSNERISVSGNSFDISYEINYDREDIRYRILCYIVGQVSGKISYKIRGEALSTFMKNRIGFCVLHPPDCAGNSCQIQHCNGSETDGLFPEFISPHQPFKDIKSIAWTINDQCKANIEFEGEVFEMEDQRNWSDASFKTYCTPLVLPFPVKVKKGDIMEQEIRIEMIGQPVDPKEDRSVTPFIDWEGQCEKLPFIGISDSKYLLSEKETALISAVNLSHLKIELDLTSQNWYDELEIGLGNACDTLLNVELVLLFGPEPEFELQEFKGAYVWDKTTVITISVIRKENHITDRGLQSVITQIQEMFPGVKVGGGSGAYFTELNRNVPGIRHLEFLTYSITPQVHAYDDLSLIENLEGQSATVLSAGQLGKDLPIHVSPVTLLPRFNPDATDTESTVIKDTLPPEVDVRQPSLFNMVWTLGSIKQLTSAGAGLITYYETKGWGGIINGDDPLSFMERSGSRPGDVYPVYAVFYLIGNFKHSGYIKAESCDPHKYEIFVLNDGVKYRIFFTNFTLKTIKILVEVPRPEGRVLRIDNENVKDLMSDPLLFFETNWKQEEFAKGIFNPELVPYSLLVIDI